MAALTWTALTKRVVVNPQQDLAGHEVRSAVQSGGARPRRQPDSSDLARHVRHNRGSIPDASPDPSVRQSRRGEPGGRRARLHRADGHRGVLGSFTAARPHYVTFEGTGFASASTEPVAEAIVPDAVARPPS